MGGEQRTWRLIKVLPVVFTALASVPALAESGSLTLGSGSGLPGDNFRLPIYLTLPRNHQFERIDAVVELPPSLTFERVEVEAQAREEGVAIEVKEPSPRPAGEKGRLEITLRAGKNRPLSVGMVGWLLLTLAEQAQPQMVSLPVTDVRGFPEGSLSPVKLRGDAGSATIYESGMEPQFSCFFYMH
jgi:hypothetical protein